MTSAQTDASTAPEAVLDFEFVNIAVLEELDQFAELAFVHRCFRPFSGALDVVAGAGIDLEFIALIDKEWYLHYIAGFERG